MGTYEVFVETDNQTAGETSMHDSPRHRDNFSLKEGALVLEYPSNMSAESYDYFERWILLILEKTKPDKLGLIDGPGVVIGSYRGAGGGPTTPGAWRAHGEPNSRGAHGDGGTPLTRG